MVVYSSVQYTTINSGSLPYILLFPKPLLVYGSMLLLSTLLVLSSYSIIVVMLGYDWGLRMVINTTRTGSGFVFAAFAP